MARIKYWDEESQTWKYADKSLGVNIDLTEYAKKEDIPTKLPNPNALTITGAVNATYDGSEAVEVEIPSGGSRGASFELIADVTVDSDVALIDITEDINGNPFNLKECFVVMDAHPALAEGSSPGINYKLTCNRASMAGKTPWSGYGVGYGTPKAEGEHSWRSALAEVATDGLVFYKNITISYNNDSMLNSHGYEKGILPSWTFPQNANKGFDLENYQTETDKLNSHFAVDPGDGISRVAMGSYVKSIGAGSRLIVYGVRM